MSPCSHVASAVCVSTVIVALAGLWPGVVQAQPLGHQLNSINDYQTKVQFLKTIMLMDQMWWPVLKGSVTFESPSYIDPLDHYSEEALENDQGGVIMTEEPFFAIMNLMKSNSILGTEVELAMLTAKSGLTCMVFRHISFQGLLVYQMLSKVKQRWGTMLEIVEWLEQMIRLSIDKLAALELAHAEVANLHLHTRRILIAMQSKKMENPYDVSSLENVSMVMYEELGRRCTSPTSFIYKSLVVDLKQAMRPDALKEFDMKVTNERLRGVPEMYDIKDLLIYRGDLQIDNDVEPYHLAQLDATELKKIVAVNYVRTTFVLLNLSIGSLADDQWANLFNMKPLSMSNANNIVRHYNE